MLEGLSSGARLYQHRGERHEIRASRLPQREAMAISFNDIALDRGGFRRLKAHKQLPALRATLEAHRTKASTHGVLARQADARVVNLGNDGSAMFNKRRDIPSASTSY